MNLSRLKPASDCDVMEWLEKKIPNLTPYQKEKIHPYLPLVQIRF